ncbi:MAG: hypothetical protein JO060_09355 [Candidatus Eremiobacteraeota bacterium]|nr:hypothetical protein [Candidatus Eremiobacteraeota bacterium]
MKHVLSLILVALSGESAAVAAVPSSPARMQHVRFAACGWKADSSAFVESGSLNAIAADSSSDVWAVGSLASSSQLTSKALFEHFDGTRWQSGLAVTVPNTETVLTGASALAANDVWAVGTFNQPEIQFGAITEHWNGKAWSLIQPVAPVQPGDPNFFAFTAVVAVASNDVWAVGYSHTGTRPGTLSLAEHWDGTQWSIIPTPNVGNPPHGGFGGVAAGGTNDVWAVGSAAGPPLSEHWDGKQWTVVPMPSPPGSPVAVDLKGATEIASNDVWAVGTVNGLAAITYHWDGRTWKIISSPNVQGARNGLVAVSHFSSSDVWAAGSVQGSDTRTLVEHWNGAAWSIQTTPNPSSPNRQIDDTLAGILALAPQNVIAVGRAFPTSLVEEFCR